MEPGVNAKGYPPKPWTVVTYQVEGIRGLATRYCAKNMLTGEQKQARKTYTEALADIPVGQQREGNYAEPWGV